MTEPIMGLFTFVILFITMMHFPTLMIILVIWAQDYYYLDGGIRNGNEINNWNLMEKYKILDDPPHR